MERCCPNRRMSFNQRLAEAAAAERERRAQAEPTPEPKQAEEKP